MSCVRRVAIGLIGLFALSSCAPSPNDLVGSTSSDLAFAFGNIHIVNEYGDDITPFCHIHSDAASLEADGFFVSVVSPRHKSFGPITCSVAKKLYTINSDAYRVNATNGNVAYYVGDLALELLADGSVKLDSKQRYKQAIDMFNDRVSTTKVSKAHEPLQNPAMVTWRKSRDVGFEIF